MDRVMNFQIYFPHNNISKIIEDIEKGINPHRRRRGVSDAYKLRDVMSKFFGKKNDQNTQQILQKVLTHRESNPNPPNKSPIQISSERLGAINPLKLPANTRVQSENIRLKPLFSPKSSSSYKGKTESVLQNDDDDQRGSESEKDDGGQRKSRFSQRKISEFRFGSIRSSGKQNIWEEGASFTAALRAHKNMSDD